MAASSSGRTTHLLLAVLVFLVVGVLPARGAPDDGPAQTSPLTHNQWQPQTEGDPRLQQPLQVEIIGRAAVPALKILSERTGVALRVAPGDLDTVGERKLTLIAQGCDLKSIMVQLPRALQECHWDVDSTGPLPVYLLHRNGGAEAMLASLSEQRSADFEAGRQPSRQWRIEAARRALAMSADELAELRATDPLLAATVQDPDACDRLKRFLALPPESLQQFTETGRVTMPFPAAPETLQAAVRRYLEQATAAAKTDDDAADVQAYLDHPESVTVGYEDWNPVADCGSGTLLRISRLTPSGGLRSRGNTALPPRLPAPATQPPLLDLLVKTGTDPKEAQAQLAELAQSGEQVIQEFMDRRHQEEEPEPSETDLHRVVALPVEGRAEAAEVERLLARETGYSVIADYFTDRPLQIPAEATEGMPLWKLLYALNRAAGGDLTWTKRGQCLVFHHRSWYERIPQEVPESVILACRQKLQEQGGLTLDDVAAVASALASPRTTSLVFPPDLEEAGLGLADTPLVQLYAPLSPEQRAKARGPQGLLYRGMTPTQRKLVARTAALALPSMPADLVPQARFRVTEQRGGAESARDARYEFALEFPKPYALRGPVRIPRPPVSPKPAVAPESPRH